MTVKILGQIGKLSPTITLVVFLGALVVIILIEKFVDKVEEWCVENRYDIVFNKLQNQLMNLGIISFVVFAIESFSGQYELIFEALHPFEFTHIILLSIAIAFVCQSVLLVRHSIHESKATLISLREPSSNLKEEYDNMMRDPKSRKSKAFLKYPSWLALFHLIPENREHIENKIMERFFMKIHRFPASFDFAKYVYYLFQSYIVSLGQVSTFGWILVMVCVLMNYFRLMVIDPSVSHCYTNSTATHGDDHYADDHHESNDDHHATDDDHALDDHALDDHATTDDHATDDHAVDDHATTDDHAGGHRLLTNILSLPVKASVYVARQLSGGGEESEGEHAVADDGFDCEDNYVLSFAIFCAIILCIFILIVYIVSNIYYDRMIERCGNVGFKSHITFQGEDGRTNYSKCLEELIELENSHEIDHNILNMSAKFGPGHGKSNHHGAGAVRTLPDVLKESKRAVARELHEEIVMSKEPVGEQISEYFSNMYHAYEHQFEHITWNEEDIPNPYKDFFIANVPGLFFLAVELSVFMQCFYISIWATQLLPIARQSADGAVWIFILSLPVFINFFIVRHILVIAVMLKGFVELDHKLVAHVCEDLNEELHRLEELGKRVRHKHQKYNDQFAKLQIPLPPMIIVIHMLSEHGRSFELDKTEFRKFLGKHTMFLDHDQFRALWSCIDANLSGSISWDEIFITVFPDMEENIKKMVSITEKMKQQCLKETRERLVGMEKKLRRWMERLHLQRPLPEATWREYLDRIACELQNDPDTPDVISVEKFYRHICGLRVFEGNFKHAAFNKWFREVMPEQQEKSDETEFHPRAHRGNDYPAKGATITKQEFLLLVDPVCYYREYVQPNLPEDIYENDELVVARHHEKHHERQEHHDAKSSYSLSQEQSGEDGHGVHVLEVELTHSRSQNGLPTPLRQQPLLQDGEEHTAPKRKSSLFNSLRFMSGKDDGANKKGHPAAKSGKGHHDSKAGKDDDCSSASASGAEDEDAHGRGRGGGRRRGQSDESSVASEVGQHHKATKEQYDQYSPAVTADAVDEEMNSPFENLHDTALMHKFSVSKLTSGAGGAPGSSSAGAAAADTPSRATKPNNLPSLRDLNGVSPAIQPAGGGHVSNNNDVTKNNRIPSLAELNQGYVPPAPAPGPTRNASQGHLRNVAFAGFAGEGPNARSPDFISPPNSGRSVNDNTYAGVSFADDDDDEDGEGDIENQNAGRSDVETEDEVFEV